MTLRVGSIITVNRPEPLYGYDQGFLMPGETATVINPKVPAVRGNKPYFAYCELTKPDGTPARVGVFPDNIRQVR